MIHLTDEERRALWDALAIAKDYYEERGQKEKGKMACDLLIISTMVEKVTFELYKNGITGEGRKILQEFMQNREKRRREESNVVLFPRGRK